MVKLSFLKSLTLLLAGGLEPCPIHYEGIAKFWNY
jgi:hypothetical protein